MIKHLKEELHRAIQLYGIAHEKTIEISQRLDIEIVKEQKVRMKKYEKRRMSRPTKYGGRDMRSSWWKNFFRG